MTAPDLLTAQTVAEVRGPWDEPYCTAEDFVAWPFVILEPTGKAAEIMHEAIEAAAREIERVLGLYGLPLATTGPSREETDAEFSARCADVLAAAWPR